MQGQQTGNSTEQSRLAASRCPDDAEQVMLLQHDRDILHHNPVAKGDRNLVEGDFRRLCTHVRCALKYVLWLGHNECKKNANTIVPQCPQECTPGVAQWVSTR